MGWNRRIIQLLGEESLVTCRLQRIRESVLRTVYGRRGMPRRVNGVPVRVCAGTPLVFRLPVRRLSGRLPPDPGRAWDCLFQRRCESGDVPSAVRPLVGPEWRRVSRSSPIRTLRQPSADTLP